MSGGDSEAPVLLLASASPRRAEILTSLGIRFQVRPAEIAETLSPGEDATAATKRLAQAKAMAVFGRGQTWPVLAADTLVVLGGTLLGKPASPADAARMLERLSGQTHHVVTGVCLITGDSRQTEAEISEVRFARLTPAEIAWYTATGEPDDKAGAYAVQGHGARFIEEIRGSFTNVVGLPARRVYEMLCRAGLLTLALPGERR